MLSVTTAIDRPQSVAQLLCNRMCISIILARKPVNHTSWVAVVTPTDRPKSVRNRCVIELFCGVVYVVTLPF